MADSPMTRSCSMVGVTGESPKGMAPLPESLQRGVTESDLALYGKMDFSDFSKRQILKRCFDAFDVQKTGVVDANAAKEMSEFLGEQITKVFEEDFQKLSIANPQGISFDAFADWFQQMSLKNIEATEETFHLVQTEFAAPFEQQQLSTEEVGTKGTLDYKCYFFFTNVETNVKTRISPWHDIPLYVRDLVRTRESQSRNRVNFICEIPKWTRQKFEIARSVEYNPIKQDVKNGLPRVYVHGDMLFNYGAFPQTWESTRVNFSVGNGTDETVKGDNDPLDAIEIGMRQMKTGEVSQVKVLGVLGMIDDGEMDWKVVVIDIEDPIAKFLNDIDDVPKYHPGCLEAMREWLRVYKICQGGVENKFAYDGAFRNASFAYDVVQESHLMWQNLKKVLKKSTV